MRIDDENKVVWCNEEELEWHKTYNTWQNDKRKMIVYHLARMGFGHALTNRNGSEAEKFWYKLDSIKLELIKAVIDNYKFKLEEPKKYFWRKKKELVLWFENEGKCYLNFDIEEEDIFLHNERGSRCVKTKFTEQEARNLLKDDFDKFEKVECE